MNENITFYGKKLETRTVIHGCFMVNINFDEQEKTIKILHTSHFCEHISGYQGGEKDLFYDASQEVKLQTSYKIYLLNIFFR